ncbi:hypothetical protein [Bifidobacterium parmae]|uniref:30S ribosomal protein S14 n=1 Tax=Bifidobacterium parmae TaxID=361854 RepID=A0A2N5J6D0_9BIFI|nr:hypothetical protein [Bifidobacterium parmae]PLS29756.1 30S ribosomal protein S14 [Bifidobacterium parmae]
MKKTFAMLLTVGMTLGVGACGQSATNSADTLTWEQSNQEYKKTTENFPFALSDGDQFPSDMTKATSDNQLYQKGWGEGQAYFYWICSTENKILNNSDDGSDQQSLSELEKVTDTDWFKTYYIDEDNVFKNEVIGKAQLGDTSVMQQFYDSDCTWYRDVNGL